ncbi:hypothetical protein POX_h09587 [Penicillium oxalicum]|uniref:hypothetical protein n=1 Tax=Penicillium oxalicum TaxID=69781 RepID=UPI0020B6BE0C|nr:hypothetical protein POX_h09587 [Penicillium oxalicum]KAI2785826.1 hypothetical protein POX_h09587 [Penicillium oxalicum]
MQLAREQQLEKILNSQATLAFGHIDDIVLKLEPLKADANATRFDKFIAKLRWHLTKDEAQVPLITLNSVKLSLTALTCLLVLDSSMADLRSQSISESEKETMILQIKHLRRMINRQERCLRRLAKKMDGFMNTDSQPKWVINTKNMVVIMQEIKKEPIAEAEALIKENIPGSPIPMSPPTETPLPSRMSFQQPLPGPNNVSGSLDISTNLSETEMARQIGTEARRQKERETRVVFHDYGDGNRETYEVVSSTYFRPTSHSGGSGLSTYGYVPVPPFNLSDLKLRKRRKRGN